MSVPDALTGVDPRKLGERLRAARRARGMTQEDVARRLDVSRTTVTAMEGGDRNIRPEELVTLAGLYGRTIGELVQRAEPIEPFSVQLRSTLPPDATSEDLGDSIFEFQRLAEDYVELERLAGLPAPSNPPPTYEIDRERPERSAEDVATRERHRMGLGDAPILNLRELLEGDVGLRIFYLDLPSRVAAMFASGAEVGPCVAVNRKHPAERRRHSLAHEFGHFLTDRYKPEVSVLGRYERVPAGERFAEAFGRAFLLPISGITRRFNDVRRARGGTVTVADLCVLAHRFFVSLEAMVRRLVELDLIPIGTWERLKAEGFKVREAQSILGLDSQPETADPLPLRYRYLAVELFADGTLSEGQLARYLRADRVEARRLAARLSGPSDVSEEGKFEQDSFDLSSVI